MLILVAIIVGGGAFYGGMRYARATAVPARSGGLAGNRQGGFGGNAQARGGNGAFGGAAMGEVVSKDANSFTLKLRDGGSKVVFYNASTTIGSMTQGSANDIKEGAYVTVGGPANQDGSVTAQSVQIRPAPPEGAMGQSAPSADTAATYSMDDVAKHASTSDCWAVVNGGVYNLTSWISQHPGGPEAISSLCGKDGSKDFNEQHGGERRPEQTLASFKIGTVK